MRAIDREGEDAAAAHALARGASVLARNWRGGGGELDLVLREGKVVAFAEVKTRATGTCGEPAESVTRAKVRRLTRAALAFLQAHGLGEPPCRFDVFSVVPGEGRLEVTWTKAAFDAAEDYDH